MTQNGSRCDGYTDLSRTLRSNYFPRIEYDWSTHTSNTYTNQYRHNVYRPNITAYNRRRDWLTTWSEQNTTRNDLERRLGSRNVLKEKPIRLKLPKIKKKDAKRSSEASSRRPSTQSPAAKIPVPPKSPRKTSASSQDSVKLPSLEPKQRRLSSSPIDRPSSRESIKSSSLEETTISQENVSETSDTSESKKENNCKDVEQDSSICQAGSVLAEENYPDSNEHAHDESIEPDAKPFDKLEEVVNNENTNDENRHSGETMETLENNTTSNDKPQHNVELENDHTDYTAVSPTTISSGNEMKRELADVSRDNGVIEDDVAASMGDNESPVESDHSNVNKLPEENELNKLSDATDENTIAEVDKKHAGAVENCSLDDKMNSDLVTYKVTTKEDVSYTVTQDNESSSKDSSVETKVDGITSREPSTPKQISPNESKTKDESNEQLQGVNENISQATELALQDDKTIRKEEATLNNLQANSDITKDQENDNSMNDDNTWSVENQTEEYNTNEDKGISENNQTDLYSPDHVPSLTIEKEMSGTEVGLDSTDNKVEVSELFVDGDKSGKGEIACDIEKGTDSKEGASLSQNDEAETEEETKKGSVINERENTYSSVQSRLSEIQSSGNTIEQNIDIKGRVNSCDMNESKLSDKQQTDFGTETNTNKCNETATSSLSSSKTVADAVNNSEIATELLNSGEVATQALNSGEVATESLNSGEVATESLSSDKVATDSQKKLDDSSSNNVLGESEEISETQKSEFLDKKTNLNNKNVLESEALSSSETKGKDNAVTDGMKADDKNDVIKPQELSLIGSENMLQLEKTNSQPILEITSDVFDNTREKTNTSVQSKISVTETGDSLTETETETYIREGTDLSMKSIQSSTDVQPTTSERETTTDDETSKN